MPSQALKSHVNAQPTNQVMFHFIPTHQFQSHYIP